MKRRKSDNTPIEEKKIYYGKRKGKFGDYIIWGVDGFGKKIEICTIPSPKVFLFKILPKYRNLSKNQIMKFEDLYDRLQPKIKKDPKSITSSIRKYIFKRDNWTCAYCGHHNNGKNDIILQVDHKIPISKGGSNNPENLITSCWKCNLKKSNKIELPKKDDLGINEITEKLKNDNKS